MFEGKKILIAEDDRTASEAAARYFQSFNGSCDIVTTVADAKKAIEETIYDFVFSDLHLETTPGVQVPDGLQIISFAHQTSKSTVIVATSSDPRADTWNAALKAGAQNFIRKPLSRADELLIAFGLASERKLLTKTSSISPFGRWKQYAERYPDGIVLDSSTQKRVNGMARHPDKVCVIIGETGTGKEEIAKMIHMARCRADGQVPFVVVNCATISGLLVESVLFGHRKGAFTGADKTTNGFIGEADRGILFLDEIQTLDISTQQKLLRVLNDGSYNRLGDSKTLYSRFQLIAASTRDLDEEVEQGRFMMDLRTRMTGLDIRLKPLRERPEDIPALTALFLAKRRIEFREKDFQELSDFLQKFYWRGNIRQFFKILDAWVLGCELDDIPLSLATFPITKSMGNPVNEVSSNNSLSPAKIERNIAQEPIQFLSEALSKDVPIDAYLDAYEKMIISGAIARHKNIGSAATGLAISRSTFDARRRKHGMA